MYTMDPGTQDGVSIWHRRRSLAPKDRSMRRRRTWTHSSTEGRSKGAHAVEFSKTVAPLREGDSFPGRVRECFRSRSGPVSIAPAPPHGERTSNGSPEQAKCPWLRQLYHPYLEGRVGPFRPAPGGSLCRRSRPARVTTGARESLCRRSRPARVTTGARRSRHAGSGRKAAHPRPARAATTGPARSRSAGAVGRRNRSGRPAARCRAGGGPRRSGSSQRVR